MTANSTTRPARWPRCRGSRRRRACSISAPSRKATYADIRFGYLVVPEALIDVFELAQRHMGMLTSITMQDALAEFIGAGAYLGHIRRMTRLYKGRRDRMLQALAAEAGDRLAVEAPAGGMQLLAQVPTRPTTSNCRRGCSRPASSAGRYRACCITRRRSRACFSALRRGTEKEIDQAARILGRIVR